MVRVILAADNTIMDYQNRFRNRALPTSCEGERQRVDQSQCQQGNPEQGVCERPQELKCMKKLLQYLIKIFQYDCIIFTSVANARFSLAPSLESLSHTDDQYLSLLPSSAVVSQFI